MHERPPAPADVEVRSAGFGASENELGGGLRQTPLSVSDFKRQVQQRAVVPYAINLKKSTLQIHRTDQDSDVYVVDFEFDATVDGFITVYYVASPLFAIANNIGKNSTVDRLMYSEKVRRRPSKTKFQAGFAQRYRQKIEKGLDTRLYDESDLVYNADGARYPIVICLEAKYPDDTAPPEASRMQAQATMATFTPYERQCRCDVLGQHVLVAGTVYRLQELYGIAGEVTATRHSMSGNTAHDDSIMESQTDSSVYSTSQLEIGGSECVICLTEPCSIAVIPCNHLCVCDDCGEKLHNDLDLQRRRCPICRTVISDYIRVLRHTAPSKVRIEGRTDVASASYDESGQEQDVNHGGSDPDARDNWDKQVTSPLRSRESDGTRSTTSMRPEQAKSPSPQACQMPVPTTANTSNSSDDCIPNPDGTDGIIAVARSGSLRNME